MDGISFFVVIKEYHESIQKGYSFIENFLLSSEKEKNEKRDEELLKMENELLKEKRVRVYKDEFGMPEEMAKEMAALEIKKDMDSWGKTLEEHIKNVKREAANNAIQKFLAERPEIKAGNGDAEMHSSSIDVALSRMNHDSGVDTDALSKYM